jgi:hypothetical protein
VGLPAGVGSLLAPCAPTPYTAHVYFSPSQDYMAPEVLICPDKRRPEENKDKVLLAYTAQVCPHSRLCSQTSERAMDAVRDSNQ